MEEKIQALMAEIESADLSTPALAEAFRNRYVARKGVINELFDQLKTVPNEEKRKIGALLNQLKNRASEIAESALASRSSASDTDRPDDITLPGDPWNKGGRHPLTLVQKLITDTFHRMGYSLAEGPEIEDDWHNFTALNFEENHPAREMQDTFFIDETYLLRTHCTSVQVRVMEKHKPPLRVISPGRVYRNEAVSARAHCFFHQIDGFCVDKDISFADLKQTLETFTQTLFGQEARIRLRPSYFPFTEISAEMDVSCRICKGSGCAVCKHSGWVEIMGCGMIDPNVLKNCGMDPEVYSGFAFGMGVERIAQLLYRVPDLRLYSQNDVRFLEQFRGFVNY
jgi:phenylalanyl-tRNA synthetase alpha chain